MVGDQNGKDHTVTLFDPILSQITADIDGNSLAIKLLNTPTLTFLFNSNGVVFAANEIN